MKNEKINIEGVDFSKDASKFVTLPAADRPGRSGSRSMVQMWFKPAPRKGLKRAKRGQVRQKKVESLGCETILGYTTDIRERFRHGEKALLSSAIETENARSEDFRRAFLRLVVNSEG